MRRLPIRWKFALWAAALVGVVLLVFSAGTLLNLYHEQLEAVDLSLAAQVRHLGELETASIAEASLDEVLRYEPWHAMAVFDADGHMVRRSPELPAELARDAVAQPVVHSAPAPDGEVWRLTSIRHGRQTIVVAHALTEVRDITTDLIWSYALSLPVVLVIAALGGWWVAGRAMQPLRDLATAAESVRADRPEWRVPAAAFSAGDEIQRLSDVLNAMLTRLEKSFQQSQRFAADASHELRTPLTIVRGEIDRVLRFPSLDPAIEEKLLSFQEEILRLDRITEHLLLLTRFDAGNAAMRKDALDLSKLVANACEDAELLCASTGIELRATVPPNIRINGDATHLRRALLNLFDNAVRYNLPDGRVTCDLNAREHTVEIRVRNTGPAIPAEARSQLFQRFFRADAARLRGGHGLGLSLAREIVRAHGGDVSLVETSDPGWIEFMITLPLPASGPPAP